MNYTYGFDNSCDNIVIEYIYKKDEKNSMKFAHYHDFYEFYFCLSDTLTYCINKLNYKVFKNDLIFVNKNTYHRAIYKSNEINRVLIMFREEVFDILADKTEVLAAISILSKTPIMRFDDDTKKEICRMAFNLAEYYSTNKDNICKIKIMLIDFILSIKDYIDKGLLREGVANTYNGLILSDVINYLNSNYNSEITLDFLSSRFYIQKHYLCHLFKRNTGMTIMEFINKKRLSEAQKLLKSSDHTISDISGIVGFRSQNYFNLMFKRAIGMTPSEFKTKSRG